MCNCADCPPKIFIQYLCLNCGDLSAREVYAGKGFGFEARFALVGGVHRREQVLLSVFLCSR